MAEPARSALIVASDTYTDPGLGQLRAPAQDAAELARVLGDQRIGGFEVRTVFNAPAHEINLAIEDFFADRRPDDLLLLQVANQLTVVLGAAGGLALASLTLAVLDEGWVEYAIAIGLLAVLAVVVPTLSVLVVPRRLGRAVLAGWIAGSTAVFAVHVEWDSSGDNPFTNPIENVGGTQAGIFGLTLVGLLVLWVVMLRRDTPADRDDQLAAAD